MAKVFGEVIAMEEEVNSLTFYWYTRPEEYNEDGELSIDVSAGRLRHRWVPITKQSARLFLKNHPEAEGLRQAAEYYNLVRVTVVGMEDISSSYPRAVIPELAGAVIRTPFREVIPKLNRNIEQEAYFTSAHVVETYKPKQFDSLEMGLMNESEIREMSVVEVLSAGSFQDNNPEDDQTPTVNGVHDLRMGAFDKRGGTCQTCGKGFDSEDFTNSCPGHFGRIELATPIPKLQFLGVNGFEAKGTFPLMSAINSVCHSCSRIMIPQQVLEAMRPNVMKVFDANKRNYSGHKQVANYTLSKFKEVHGTKAEDRQPCPHCSSFSPKFLFNHVSAEFRTNPPDERYEEGARRVAFDRIRDILLEIPDEDCYFLGMDPKAARPEDMFFTAMPVSPNAIRPPRALPGKKLKEIDDLTKLYQDVVNYNERLSDIRIRRLAGEARFTQELYKSVSRVYDNQKKVIGSGGTTQQRGFGGTVRKVSLKGIMNRLAGKKGRFRNNLQSKYVEEVGYSTITPNGDLAIDQVGVPIDMAKKSTVLERVTAENMTKLKELVLRGPDKYPGALYVIVDGDKFNKSKGNYKATKVENRSGTYYWTEQTADNFIREGALVMRHVIDGDIGLFNRAPSLHRQSLLAMRAKIIPTKSLAMNPTICIPFNADYDGDAMKIHFVQSEEAIEEAKRLMQLDKNIIHARYGKLTVATDQDQTSGLYLLTHTDKRRRNEWNSSTGLGFTDEGIPYLSKSLATRAYTYVYSEIRNEDDLKALYKQEKSASTEKMPKYAVWASTPKYRRVDSLPEPDTVDGDGNSAYTGRAIFSHLFTVLGAEYVSATFKGNSPAVDEDGMIVRDEANPLIIDPTKKFMKKQKERIIVYKGKLVKGTLEKDSFGEGGSSLAPPFIYHEGYEKGQQKLVEYIEMVTRLGYAGHHVIGFTMGADDVGFSYAATEPWLEASSYRVEDNPEYIAEKKMFDMYDQYAERIRDVTDAYMNRDAKSVAENESERVLAITEPADFLEEKIVDLATEYEERSLGIIEDVQGSGNPMQVAVRSKARGKDQNVRQMGGSFGIVLVGGKRIVHGVNAFRALPHFPRDDNHPKYTGFVKSGYSKGMDALEYWQTSSAGRRSTVESGQGNISKSGYLERKMIKALEPLVVNDRKQVVNVRTGRIVSPLVGEDGLSPYHIRGSHEDTNKDGRTITLQPLLFEFECKHGKPLESRHADELLEHRCDECSKSSNFDKVEDELSKLSGFEVSKATLSKLKSDLEGREIDAPTLRKMAKRLHAFYNDSICRTGEAIGATAGGCLGEPATQAALRSFHFAGKMSFQGSVDRLEQMLESPLRPDKIFNPQIKVKLKEYLTEEDAKKLAAACRRIVMTDIIDYIGLDVNQMILRIKFDSDNVRTLRLDKSQVVIAKQISSALNRSTIGIGSFEVLSQSLDYSSDYVIRILSNEREALLRAKESILSAKASGLTDARLVIVESDKKGRFGLDIRESSMTSLNNVYNKLADYIDQSSITTNNLAWVYHNFGIEAMLTQFVNELDVQMNGGAGVKGVGEYDSRYSRTIADLMGEEGIPLGLGPKSTTSLGSMGNYSILSACSTEGIPNSLVGGAVMGNFDDLNGPAEAIVTGSVPKIGDYAPASD